MSAAAAAMLPPDGFSAPDAKKRGRPRDPIISYWRPNVVMRFPELRSRRAVENRCYVMHALRELLETSTPWGWLLDEAGVAAGTAVLPFTVLAELGRLRVDEDIRGVASAILDRQIRREKAATFVRLIRREIERDREVSR